MIFGDDVLTVVRQATDRHGDPIGPPAQTPITGCYVQPRGVSDEDNDLRTTTVTGWLVFVPPGADIRPGDRVRWHGDDYEVEGDPAVWSPPVGPEHHLEVVLKRVKG
jgi:hypothetical protein